MHVAFGVSYRWKVSGDMRHMTHDTWHRTHDTWHKICFPFHRLEATQRLLTLGRKSLFLYFSWAVVLYVHMEKFGEDAARRHRRICPFLREKKSTYIRWKFVETKPFTEAVWRFLWYKGLFDTAWVKSVLPLSHVAASDGTHRILYTKSKNTNILKAKIGKWNLHPLLDQMFSLCLFQCLCVNIFYFFFNFICFFFIVWIERLRIYFWFWLYLYCDKRRGIYDLW